MDVHVEKLGGCRARVSFKVPQSEFESQYNRGLKNIARRTRMKGFRPGKTPLGVVEKQYGDEVRHETAQYFFNQAMQRAVEENELQPAASPRIDHDALHAEAGADFERELEVSLRPEFELGPYKGLEIEGQPVALEDEELERTLTDLRQQQARPEPAGDEGLPADGMALAKIVLEYEGETVLEREGLRLSPGGGLLGCDAEAFEKGLTGTRDGDTFELPFAFPDQFEKEELRGKEGLARIEVQQAFRIVQPSDEELCKLADVEDMDALREKVRTKMMEAKEDQERIRVESTLLEEVLAAHPMELPEDLLQQQVEAQIAETRKKLVESGAPQEEIDRQVEGESQAAYEAAAKSMRAVYLLEAIAQKEGIQVSDEDMLGELRLIAQRNGVPVDEVQAYYKEQRLFNQLALELLERKVRGFLRENATIH